MMICILVKSNFSPCPNWHKFWFSLIYQQQTSSSTVYQLFRLGGKRSECPWRTSPFILSYGFFLFFCSLSLPSSFFSEPSIDSSSPSPRPTPTLVYQSNTIIVLYVNFEMQNIRQFFCENYYVYMEIFNECFSSYYNIICHIFHFCWTDDPILPYIGMLGTLHQCMSLCHTQTW